MAKPPFIPTLQDRERVLVLTLAGESQERIADLIYCSVPTLRRAFAAELAEAKSRRRARAANSTERSRKRRALEAAGFGRLDLWIDRETRDQLRDGLVDLGRLSEGEEDDDAAFLHALLTFAADAISFATRSERYKPPMKYSVPDVRNFDWEGQTADEDNRDEAA